MARSYADEAIDQEDLLQEIALGLWTALTRFRGDASERTSLYRVAHDTGISFVARRKRLAQRERGGTPPDLTAPSISPKSAVIGEEQRARLWAAVGELPLKDRQIVVLHFEGCRRSRLKRSRG